MTGPPGNAPAPDLLENSQRSSPRTAMRGATVESLIREARDAGYDGAQRRLVRLVRRYIDARQSCSFAVWLGYADPTGLDAVRSIMGAGGQHATT